MQITAEMNVSFLLQMYNCVFTVNQGRKDHAYYLLSLLCHCQRTKFKSSKCWEFI